MILYCQSFLAHVCSMYFVEMFIFLITNEYAIVRRGVVNFYDVQRYGGNKRNYYYY